VVLLTRIRQFDEAGPVAAQVCESSLTIENTTALQGRAPRNQFHDTGPSGRTLETKG